MEFKDLWVFAAGFLSCALVFYGLIYTEAELPSGLVLADSAAVSPTDRVAAGDIMVTEDTLVLHVSGASISEYAATGSMRPLLDEGANGIRIVPQQEEDIGVGDIISFRQNGNLIVHRVVGIGTDEEGGYFITQGDNTTLADGKVRFEEIEYVTIGVIW